MNEQNRTPQAAERTSSDFPPELVDRKGCPFHPPRLLRADGGAHPVRRQQLSNGEAEWVVTGHAESRTVLADPCFSSVPPPGRAPASPGFFISADGAEHRYYRKMLAGRFTIRRLRILEERVESIVANQIDEVLDCRPPVDLVRSFALPVPSLVISELLGVPVTERPMFEAHAAVLVSLDSTDDERAAALEEVRTMLSGLVETKRRTPEDDLLSDLISSEPTLGDIELSNMMALLLLAGHETTANMIALSSLLLIEDPERQEAIKDPSRVDAAVEELLRYLSIVQFTLPRTATEHAVVGGETIPRGAVVYVSTTESNRDDHVWPDPDTIDMGRPKRPHLAFGYGVHQCLGQNLARVEMRIALRELFTRIPSLSLGEPVDDDNFRHNASVHGLRRLPVTWRVD